MSKKYDNILDKLYDTPWLTTKGNLELILSIVDRKMAGEELDDQLLNKFKMDRESEGELGLQLPTSPSVAILPIHGSIFPKANMMTSLSGGTSMDSLKADFNTLLGSEMVTAIVLDMDTPGGSVEGVKELSDHIYASRGIKPIHSIANFMAASAGLYIASQADKFWASDSAQVGSLGVVAVHTDRSAQDKTDGIKRTILSIGKNKAEFNPHEPLSDEAKAHHLETMQEVYDQFRGDVARGRGLSIDHVEENFGQGRVYRSKTAKSRGMIDGVRTLDSLVGELSHSSPNHSSASIPSLPATMSIEKKGKTMPEYTPETLTLLGLSEDATTEDVTVAIEAIKVKADAKPEVITAELISVESDFAKQYPEQAAEIARLRETDRKNSAKMYAGQYAQFTSDKGSSGMGFSSLALGLVEELHLKIADGVVTHADLTSFLDNVASGNAVVNYTEVGSTRGHEELSAENGYDAATQIRDLAYEMVASDGLSYGDAVSRVLAENTELASLYRNSIPSGGE